ncbi:uncharacterized protein, partial [Atheta coriaria]|uniref:uncharacterized protein n=1 Tax=Dalotia coriaria TaxID=877792 RepID=UPI0031F3F6EE
MPPNYINQCWVDLSKKLNSCGDGPVLTSEEWKKRFSNWKYCTQNKFRRMEVHRKATGGGPSTTISMTALEERGIATCGKTAVAGIEGAPLYEEVPLEDPENPEVKAKKEKTKTPTLLASMFQHTLTTIATPHRHICTSQKRTRRTSVIAKSTQEVLATCTNSTEATKAQTEAILAVAAAILQL